MPQFGDEGDTCQYKNGMKKGANACQQGKDIGW